MNACDPDADIENLRKLIKINAGVDIKLTKKEICEAYQDIQDGKLPLPPLVMNSTRTYLVDKKSPLKPNDYELLFDSTTKRADLKRVARKVNLKNVEQMTKSQIVDAIGKRLRYMKVHEPVKFARKRQVSVNTNTNTAVNNTAVSNVNSANFNINRVNTNVNTNRVNTNVNTNRANTNVNRVNTNVNRVNTNVNTNRVNTNVNRVNTNVNRVNTKVNRPKERNSKVTFPSGGLFTKGEKPKFLGGVKEPVGNKKPGFFAKLFGKKEKKNFVSAKKFNGSKEGYVFRQGEKGLGYYLNTGAVQGPQIPTANIIQPTPTNGDFSLDLAVARVKQLGLKREQQFLNKIQLGRSQRKQIVVEAEQAKEEENQFLAYLEQLNISNTNRNSFKRRMATDDFKQLRVEAQLKADDKMNVTRSNEEKMNMFLKTTGLSNVNKNLFLNRARKEGSNINSLIEEARSLNADIKTKKLTNKQDEFRKILQNYNKLNASDKEALIASVTETMNVNSLRKMADELLQKRIEEKQNFVAQNLLSFLTPLQINQKNKNDFLRRFRNEGANINTIKSEALKLQESKGSSNLENLRVRLETRLNEISLNQLNKNAIMRKFTNGNRNVDKLIEEAKNLKKQRNDEGLNKSQKEYRAYLNTLPGLTNVDKQQLMNNGNLNRNKAKQMSNKRLEQVKINTKQAFINFMTNIGITNQYRDELLNNFNTNRMTMNALKNKAAKIAQKIKNDKNLELKTTLNTRLDELNLSQVNKNAIMRKFTNGNRNVEKLIQEAKDLKSTRNTENMNTKRNEYRAYLNTLPGLTNVDKQQLVNNGNMNRNKAVALSNQRISNKKQSERNGFSQFLTELGLNNNDRANMMSQYNSDKLTVNALRQNAQTLKNKRVTEQKALNKQSLKNYMNRTDLSTEVKTNIEKRFNANQSNLRTLQAEINKMVKNVQNAKLANNKAKFTNYVRTTILSQTNQNAFIRKLNANNVNVSSLRQEVNAMVSRMVQVQRDKDRDELDEYMKTKGLTNGNRKTILNKFNVNSEIALKNLKQEANAIVISRIQERKNANAAELRDYMRELGLNNQDANALVTKLNRNSLNSLKTEADRIAKKKAQNRKNTDRRNLNAYMNEIGLNTNNKEGILSKNVSLNEGKKLANQTLQLRIRERREKNVIKLKLHLNNLNLTNEEKRKFYNNFNKNVNLNTIKSNASSLATSKKAQIKAEQVADLKAFMNIQGLTRSEQRPFANRLNKNQDDLNALKLEVEEFASEKFKSLKAKARQDLVKYLSKLSLDQSNVNGILKNFDNTNVNSNVLKKRAKEINKSRKNQRYAQDESEFFNYLNTLQNLTAENKTEITSKLNGYFTNWNSIKKEATDTAVQRAKERRAREKSELNNYMSNMGFNNNSKRIFFKNLDDGKNLKAVKVNAAAYKKDLNAKRKATARKGFSNFLNTLYLNNSDRAAFLEQFNDGTTSLNRLQQNAQQKEVKTIEEKKGELFVYLSELGLEAPDRNLILKNFNADPRSVNNLRNKGRQIKNARNEERRMEIRRELKEYLNGLNLLTNKNKQNILNKNLSLNNGRAEGNRAQEFKKLAKKNVNTTTLKNSIRNLSNKDQTYLLNKFETRNVTLNSVLKEAEDLRKKRSLEKRSRERNELYNFVNKLDMNVADRNSIMNKFNKTNATVNTLKNEASQLRNKRTSEKRALNRNELSGFLNTLNLSGINKRGILNRFNANKNATLTSLRTNAEELQKQRGIEKRLATRVEVERYLKKVGLSNDNTQSVLNKFNADNRISLKDASNEANAILIQRVMEKMAQNRENLVQYMNGLNISNANRATILKNFDSEAASLNNLKNRASQINTAIKAKAKERQELSNYINGLNINGNDLLNKFNNGRSTLDKLKKEADKRRVEFNARIVNNKRKELGEFMNDTLVPKQNRKSFLNRITVNTNMNSIKNDVKKLNNNIRANQEQKAVERDEFSVFLNGLELTNKEKVDLLKIYNAGKTNKDVIRNKALSINAAVKAKAAQRQELSNYINGLGINGKELLNKFNGGRSTLDKLKKEADKAKALLNAKAVNAKKDDLRAYLKETRLTNINKQSFINRVETNTNMNVIKREIRELNSTLKSRNDEVARKKTELSTYLNGLNDLTPDQRKGLIKKVINANTNIEPLKNEGIRLNKSVKNKRAEQQRLDEEKKRKEEITKRLADEKKLEKHLMGLKYLTNKDMQQYVSNFANNKATLQNLVVSSRAKDKDNEKDVDALRVYIRGATIPQAQKNTYLKQLNRPHVNITPIKSLVNANVNAEKIVVQKLIKSAEAKLKKLSNITPDERGKFKIRLSSEPVSKILEEAEKLECE